MSNDDKFLETKKPEKLIKKMGLDEHMQEALRVQDQLAMDDDQFEKFLTDRDITVCTVEIHRTGMKVPMRATLINIKKMSLRAF